VLENTKLYDGERQSALLDELRSVDPELFSVVAEALTISPEDSGTLMWSVWQYLESRRERIRCFKKLEVFLSTF
jgi:hypothetical protein